MAGPVKGNFVVFFFFEIPCCITQVFKNTYCDRFCPEKAELFHSTCLEFAHIVDSHCPELHKKLKIHLLLHITDDILKFGPASSYNTERYVHVHKLV